MDSARSNIFAWISNNIDEFTFEDVELIEVLTPNMFNPIFVETWDDKDNDEKLDAVKRLLTFINCVYNNPIVYDDDSSEDDSSDDDSSDDDSLASEDTYIDIEVGSLYTGFSDKKNYDSDNDF